MSQSKCAEARATVPSLRRLLPPLLVLLALCGCASPNRTAAKAPHVSYSELQSSGGAKLFPKMTAPPYVLSFRAGDEIPLSFAVESKLVELNVPPLVIRAKRDFWILFRANGSPLVSLDGKDFTTKSMNSFMFGIRVVKDEPPSVQGKIRYRAD